jgi:hypothetical protein
MVNRIDLGLIEKNEPRTRRRLVTRFGEGLQESGVVEIRGLDPELDHHRDRNQLQEQLTSVAIMALGLLEEYFGTPRGALTTLVNPDTSVHWSRIADTHASRPEGGHLLALSAWDRPEASQGEAGSVRRISGSWTLEVGTILQRLTNGVLSPPSPASPPGHEETLVRFLARPSPEETIAVLEGFLWPRRPARYAPAEARTIWMEGQ